MLAVCSEALANPNVVALQAFHAAGSFRRTLVLLRSRQLVDTSLEARLLAAQCLLRSGDHQECLNVLGGWHDADVQLDQQAGACERTACLLCLSGRLAYHGCPAA